LNEKIDDIINIEEINDINNFKKEIKVESKNNLNLIKKEEKERNNYKEIIDNTNESKNLNEGNISN
jgi:hypothetical protein